MQFIRANAALLVVVTHAVAVLAKPEYFNTSTCSTWCEKGAVGVDIFFVVSGFIMVYVALAPLTLAPTVSIGTFIERRFVRIVPFLWFVVISYAALRYLGTGRFEAGPYLTAAFLWPVGELRPNVVWTLRHEALFYILFALSFLLRRRRSWLLATWCAAPVVLWLGQQAGLLQAPGNELIAFLLKRNNAEFGIGVLVGLVYLKGGMVGRRMSTFFLPTLCLVTATALTFAARNSLPIAAIAVAAGAVVVCGLAVPFSNAALPRFWALLGDASYSIYLIHNLVLLVGTTAWLRIFGTGEFGLAATTLGCASVLAGLGAHLWIEKPLVRASRRFALRLHSRSKSTQPAV